jgi:multidrug resistance efflux pump
VRINSENTLFSAELALKNAKINNDTAIKNREAQLSLLENAMVDAQISYQNSQVSYAKLSVRSPIDGTIGSIFVDK